MKKHRTMRVFTALVLSVLSLCFAFAGIPVLAENSEQAVATKVNSRPIAKNLTLETFRNIAITGQFQATDPDGDAVTFDVLDKPDKGTVQTGSDGSFTYTPFDDRKGQDTFTYIACDPQGGLSDKATVKIDIQKQATDISYSDMADNSSCYDALVLAEKGVFVGDRIGDKYFFRPSSLVTRGEFLAMCLAMNDTSTLKDVVRTGFYDDDSIPSWVKPYVSTALMSGIITGYKVDDGRLVFNANDPITVSEAAVILNNVLRPTDVSTGTNGFDDSACPVWAFQAEANLEACSVIPTGSVAGGYSHSITRAEAADMLVASMRLLQNRDSGKSLLSWAHF